MAKKPKREPVVHKEAAPGYKFMWTACGRTFQNDGPHKATRDWSRVTCKNCLRTRKVTR